MSRLTKGPVVFFITILLFFFYRLSLLQTIVDPSWNKVTAWLSHLASALQFIGIGWGLLYSASILERISSKRPFAKVLCLSLSFMLMGWLTPTTVSWLIASAEASRCQGFH